MHRETRVGVGLGEAPYCYRDWFVWPLRVKTRPVLICLRCGLSRGKPRALCNAGGLPPQEGSLLILVREEWRWELADHEVIGFHERVGYTWRCNLRAPQGSIAAQL